MSAAAALNKTACSIIIVLLALCLFQHEAQSAVMVGMESEKNYDGNIPYTAPLANQNKGIYGREDSNIKTLSRVPEEIEEIARMREERLARPRMRNNPGLNSIVLFVLSLILLYLGLSRLYDRKIAQNLSTVK